MEKMQFACLKRGKFSRKLLLKMKLTFIIIMVSLMQVSATVYSQATKFSFDFQGKQVVDVLKEIEDKSDFRFFYQREQIDVTRTVNLKVNQESVEGILAELFRGRGVSYKVLEDNLIIIVPEKNKELLDQQKLVTGKVTVKTGATMPGVSVAVKGTTIGTITDTNGNFTLANVPENAILSFSFVGMKSQEVAVQGKPSINVVMEEENLALDEVIVIGYGTTKRQDFTGSVTSVKLENSAIANAPNLSVLESLKGNVAGLDIGATNTAGGEPDMLIRGKNSISGNNDPLIVLDGVIYDGPLSAINPNDISHVDVLKDAVSAAVYGSRSANGIIAITTKTGTSAKPVITFNTSAGVQSWQNRPEMMKGAEWIETVNARNGYAAGSTNWLKAGELANYTAGKETDWLKESTQTGVIQNYQIAVSGAGKGVNYYLSSSYNSDKGVVIGDDFTRISLLAKINTDITSWLKVGFDASYSKRDYSGNAASIANSYTCSPYGVMYRDEAAGLLEKYPYEISLGNPLWGVNDGIRDNMDYRYNYRLNSYAVVSVPFIKGLSYRINYVANLDQNRSGTFTYEDFYVAEGNGLARYEPATLQGFLTKAAGNINQERNNGYVFDNIITYKNKFGKHGVEATLVATRDKRTYDKVNSTGSDFALNGSTTLGLGGLHKATVQKVDLDGWEKANIGYLGRLNYNFNNKYFLTGSYRYDGASIFGADRKWGNFAGAGLGWMISEENFLKQFDKLDKLKLKFSWGQNGNQGVSPYSTLSKVANGPSGGYRYEFSNTPGKIYYGLIQSTLGNETIGWESTEALNAGFESSWFNGRLSLDVDAYKSKTTDQIFTRLIPTESGFKTIMTSLGQVDNKGIELTLRSVNVKANKFMWSSMVVFSQNRNKVAHLFREDKNGDGKEDNDLGNSLFIGEPLGAIYGYKQDGIVQTDDTEYIAATGAAAGAPKYVDLTGEGNITAEDRMILGYRGENFRLNFGNTINYRNFEFYVMAAGIFGGNGYYQQSNPNAYLTGSGSFNTNMSWKPYWTAENKSNVYPRANFVSDGGRFLGLESRSFVRIQDVSFSYSLPKKWLSSANISTFKLFVSAKNVALFTNWNGDDPETGATYLSNTFPVMSTYSVGANISF